MTQYTGDNSWPSVASFYASMRSTAPADTNTETQPIHVENVAQRPQSESVPSADSVSQVVPLPPVNAVLGDADITVPEAVVIPGDDSTSAGSAATVEKSARKTVASDADIKAALLKRHNAKSNPKV